MALIKRLTLTKPDDWHLHVRDALGEGVGAVIPFRAGETVALQLAEVESK